MIRRLLFATLALVLAACGASGGPAAAGPATGGPSSGAGAGANGGSATGGVSPTLPGGATLPPGAVPTTDVPATIDSCTVLSDEDIKLATNEGVTERKPSTLTQIFSSVCDITLDGGGSLTVSILPSTGKQLWDVSFGPFVGTDVLEVEVPGLGDAAGGSKSGDDVMVLKGDVLFDILFIEFGRQDKGPVTRHLAEIVLDKLPCLATGCAGATAPPASTGGSTVDACALLTDQEIKAATHFATTGHEAGQATDCRWTLDTGSDLPGLHSIRLAIQLTGGREQWDFLSQGLPQVPALGDGAFKLGGNTDGSIKALAGDRVISLDYSLPVQTADPDPLIIPLLKSALSRLPG